MGSSQRRQRFMQFAVVFVVTAASATVAWADEFDAARFREQLATGEFAPAWQAAAQAPADRQDAALTEIAAAQANAGAPYAAAATLAGLRDDRSRLAAIEQLFAYDVPFDPGFQPGGGAATYGSPGGGVRPDFESLIELITSTIRPSDWQDNGGTVGFIKAHPGGVFVDAAGQMKPIVNGAELARLASLRREAAQVAAPTAARRSAKLRKISLTRLEREVQLRRALGLSLDEEMRTLAGLQRVTHLFVYPESGEVVLAGPAGDWYVGRENRLLAVENDRPVLRLEDLVTLIRREFSVDGPFGCSIEPTTAGLQRVQTFVEQSKRRPLAPGELKAWTSKLRDQVGLQNIRFYGVDPQSRVAATLVEADYRMKLVGIEREPSTLQVPSYFEIVRSSGGREPPSMGLLRWWFTADYDALLTSPEHDVYELQGKGVQLLSENEFLSQQGTRIATGQADDFNRRFAANFTEHLATMAQKYPIYAELQNVFDLALVCAVLKHDRVCDRIGWHRLGFADPRVAEVGRGVVPTTVESVANGTTLGKGRVMAVISGGVQVDVGEHARSSAMRLDDRDRLAKERRSAAPPRLQTHDWWWD
jgi:hypothetical protein